MSKFQPGDLALIVSTKENHHVLGMIVTIKDIIPPNTKWYITEQLHYKNPNVGYIVRFEESQKVLFRGFDIGKHHDLFFDEAGLMPLKGDFTQEEETHENVLPCVSN